MASVSVENNRPGSPAHRAMADLAATAMQQTPDCQVSFPINGAKDRGLRGKCGMRRAECGRERNCRPLKKGDGPGRCPRCIR